MLDSDQEPSYNLSKNLSLLPRILKLIKDMVDDSTPLILGGAKTLNRKRLGMAEIYYKSETTTAYKKVPILKKGNV